MSEIAPQVEVIQDGKVMPNARIDPAVANFIFQAAQVSQAVRMRKIEESKIPVGMKSIKKTITTEVTEIPLCPPWISFSLINDGTGSITVWVNEMDGIADNVVEIDDSFSIDMTYPVINRIYIVSSSSSVVRLIGKVGRCFTHVGDEHGSNISVQPNLRD